MKKLALVFVVLLNLGMLAPRASADTLTLVSTGGQVVGNDYIYPYNFSINGSSAITPLICLDFTRNVVVGETWNVTQYAMPTGNSQTAIDYKAEALLYYGLQHGTSSQVSDYQFAAWYIFDPTATPADNPGFTTNARSLANQALANAAAGMLPQGFSYANYTLFIPTSDQTGWKAGLPQEFLGSFAPPNPNLTLPTPTPEPSSLLLLGTGVMGCASLLRKRVASRR